MNMKSHTNPMCERVAVRRGKFRLKTELGLIGRGELEEEQRRLLEIKEEIENLSN